MAIAATALAAEMSGAGEDEPRGQYVSFCLGPDRFGLPMERVREIVRPPQLVPVPLTPPAFLGLANLRGNVLPVLDLRALLGLSRQEPDHATRVIVALAEGRQAVGLRVDRIAGVLAPEDSQLDDATSVQSSIDCGLLSGVIRGGDGEDLVQLLDLDTLLADHLPAAAGRGREPGEPPPPQGAVTGVVREEGDEDDEAEVTRLVSFLISDQEYAFEIECVQEIVRLGGNVSGVPHAAAHILGMIELRGRLLPLVSLRRLFGLEEAAGGEESRILVLSARGNRNPVGVVVDQVREVLQVQPDWLDSKPPLLEQQGGLEEIERICRLDEGRRLVSIIRAGALLADPAVRAVADEAQEEEQMNETAQNAPEEEDELTQVVVFSLGDEEYGVLVESVQEITRVPEQMNRVPRTPEFIEGVINLRGTVLPVVDMRSCFGLPRQEHNERQRILVIDIEGTRTGFVTDAVSEVLRVRREAIEPAPALSEEQARILGRVVNLREAGRMIQLLEAAELFDNGQKRQLHEVRTGGEPA